MLAVAALLRGVWLTADPPTARRSASSGTTRVPGCTTRATGSLWGAWRTDNWNPVFITPVFTALEYGAFRAFGVGTWQARTVPAVSGLVAVACLAGGLAAAGGRRAALIGATLLATNYVFVMWNRAALMESTMTAFIVAAWAAYASAERRPALGLLAGGAAVLAWFTKAAAAFFVAAIIADCAGTLILAAARGLRERLGMPKPSPAIVRGGAWTLIGLAASGALALALFVLPHWTEYRFYNWQMSVTRKPVYTLRALVGPRVVAAGRARLFTRMWLATRGGRTRPRRDRGALADRASGASGCSCSGCSWGSLELIVHDSGNERRYVMFIPAFVALAALVIGRTGPLLPARGRARSQSRAGCRPRSSCSSCSSCSAASCGWRSSARCGRRSACRPRSRAPPARSSSGGGGRDLRRGCRASA